MYLRPGLRAFFSLATYFLLALVCAQPALSRSAGSRTAVRKHRARRYASVAGHAATLKSNSSGRPITRSRTQAAVLHTNTRSSLRTATARRRSRLRSRVFFNPWSEPTYADSTIGDSIDGEDLVVRKAAVDALGPFNGTVVVADSQTGRILSIVNQRLALKGAYQPCSTVKMIVSLASLQEGIVNSGSTVRISRRHSMDMTRALAMSNNLYFARLGQELGFERVQKYGKLFGLGEKAGLEITGEEPGYLASEPPGTGVGMMTSFGDGIRLTPLELTGIVTAIANGGTLFYLQYPKNQQEIEKFVPRIKRDLEMSSIIPQIKAGMMGAVEYGTARRVSYTNSEEAILGKTGTCTDTAQPGVHLGWFAAFNEVGNRKLAVVVLLTGGRGVSGPIASGITGNLYHNLWLQNYFGSSQEAALPSALLTLQNSYARQ